MKSPQSYFGIDEENVNLRGLSPITASGCACNSTSNSCVPHANPANSSTAKSSHMPLESLSPKGNDKMFKAASDPKY